MAQLVLLPDEIILEILIMGSDSIPNIIKFAMTCSSIYEVVTQRGTPLWMNVLQRMEREDRTRFKANALSILNMDLPDKCKKLMRIVSHQYRFQVKRSVISKIRDINFLDKKEYMTNIKLKDEITNGMIKRVKESLIQYYSAEHFIDMKYGGSFEKFFYFLMQNKLESINVRELVDYLFKKKNAHKEDLDLNGKVFRENSAFYRWTILYFYREHFINQLLSLFQFVKDLEDGVLLLKFIYFECPIKHQKVDYNYIQSWTGAKIDEEKRGDFLNYLDTAIKNNKSLKENTILLESISQFTLQAYGSVKI